MTLEITLKQVPNAAVPALIDRLGDADYHIPDGSQADSDTHSELCWTIHWSDDALSPDYGRETPAEFLENVAQAIRGM